MQPVRNAIEDELRTWFVCPHAFSQHLDWCFSAKAAPLLARLEHAGAPSFEAAGTHYELGQLLVQEGRALFFPNSNSAAAAAVLKGKQRHALESLLHALLHSNASRTPGFAGLLQPLPPLAPTTAATASTQPAPLPAPQQQQQPDKSAFLTLLRRVALWYYYRVMFDPLDQLVALNSSYELLFQLLTPHQQLSCMADILTVLSCPTLQQNSGKLDTPQHTATLLSMLKMAQQLALAEAQLQDQEQQLQQQLARLRGPDGARQTPQQQQQQAEDAATLDAKQRAAPVLELLVPPAAALLGACRLLSAPTALSPDHLRFMPTLVKNLYKGLSCEAEEQRRNRWHMAATPQSAPLVQQANTAKTVGAFLAQLSELPDKQLRTWWFSHPLGDLPCGPDPHKPSSPSVAAAAAEWLQQCCTALLLSEGLSEQQQEGLMGPRLLDGGGDPVTQLLQWVAAVLSGCGGQQQQQSSSSSSSQQPLQEQQQQPPQQQPSQPQQQPHPAEALRQVLDVLLSALHYRHMLSMHEWKLDERLLQGQTLLLTALHCHCMQLLTAAREQLLPDVCRLGQAVSRGSGGGDGQQQQQQQQLEAWRLCLTQLQHNLLLVLQLSKHWQYYNMMSAYQKTVNDYMSVDGFLPWMLMSGKTGARSPGSISSSGSAGSNTSSSWLLQQQQQNQHETPQQQEDRVQQLIDQLKQCAGQDGDDVEADRIFQEALARLEAMESKIGGMRANNQQVEQHNQRMLQFLGQEPQLLQQLQDVPPEHMPQWLMQLLQQHRQFSGSQQQQQQQHGQWTPEAIQAHLKLTSAIFAQLAAQQQAAAAAPARPTQPPPAAAAAAGGGGQGGGGASAEAHAAAASGAASSSMARGFLDRASPRSPSQQQRQRPASDPGGASSSSGGGGGGASAAATALSAQLRQVAREIDRAQDVLRKAATEGTYEHTAALIARDWRLSGAQALPSVLMSMQLHLQVASLPPVLSAFLSQQQQQQHDLPPHVTPVLMALRAPPQVSAMLAFVHGMHDRPGQFEAILGLGGTAGGLGGGRQLGAGGAAGLGSGVGNLPGRLFGSLRGPLDHFEPLEPPVPDCEPDWGPDFESGSGLGSDHFGPDDGDSAGPDAAAAGPDAAAAGAGYDSAAAGYGQLDYGQHDRQYSWQPLPSSPAAAGSSGGGGGGRGGGGRAAENQEVVWEHTAAADAPPWDQQPCCEAGDTLLRLHGGDGYGSGSGSSLSSGSGCSGSSAAPSEADAAAAWQEAAAPWEAAAAGMSGFEEAAGFEPELLGFREPVSPVSSGRSVLRLRGGRGGSSTASSAHGGGGGGSGGSDMADDVGSDSGSSDEVILVQPRRISTAAAAAARPSAAGAAAAAGRGGSDAAAGGGMQSTSATSGLDLLADVAAAGVVEGSQQQCRQQRRQQQQQPDVEGQEEEEETAESASSGEAVVDADSQGGGGDDSEGAVEHVSEPTTDHYSDDDFEDCSAFDDNFLRQQHPQLPQLPQVQQPPLGIRSSSSSQPTTSSQPGRWQVQEERTPFGSTFRSAFAPVAAAAAAMRGHIPGLDSSGRAVGGVGSGSSRGYVGAPAGQHAGLQGGADSSSDGEEEQHQPQDFRPLYAEYERRQRCPQYRPGGSIGSSVGGGSEGGGDGGGSDGGGGSGSEDSSDDTIPTRACFLPDLDASVDTLEELWLVRFEENGNAYQQYLHKWQQQQQEQQQEQQRPQQPQVASADAAGMSGSHSFVPSQQRGYFQGLGLEGVLVWVELMVAVGKADRATNAVVVRTLEALQHMDAAFWPPERPFVSDDGSSSHSAHSIMLSDPLQLSVLTLALLQPEQVLVAAFAPHCRPQAAHVVDLIWRWLDVAYSKVVQAATSWPSALQQWEATVQRDIVEPLRTAQENTNSINSRSSSRRGIPAKGAVGLLAAVEGWVEIVTQQQQSLGPVSWRKYDSGGDPLVRGFFAFLAPDFTKWTECFAEMLTNLQQLLLIDSALAHVGRSMQERHKLLRLVQRSLNSSISTNLSTSAASPTYQQPQEQQQEGLDAVLASLLHAAQHTPLQAQVVEALGPVATAHHALRGALDRYIAHNAWLVVQRGLCLMWEVYQRLPPRGTAVAFSDGHIKLSTSLIHLLSSIVRYLPTVCPYLPAAASQLSADDANTVTRSWPDALLQLIFKTFSGFSPRSASLWFLLHPPDSDAAEQVINRAEGSVLISLPSTGAAGGGAGGGATKGRGGGGGGSSYSSSSKARGRGSAAATAGAVAAGGKKKQLRPALQAPSAAVSDSDSGSDDGADGSVTQQRSQQQQQLNRAALFAPSKQRGALHPTYSPSADPAAVDPLSAALAEGAGQVLLDTRAAAQDARCQLDVLLLQQQVGQQQLQQLQRGEQALMQLEPQQQQLQDQIAEAEVALMQLDNQQGMYADFYDENRVDNRSVLTAQIHDHAWPAGCAEFLSHPPLPPGSAGSCCSLSSSSTSESDGGGDSSNEEEEHEAGDVSPTAAPAAAGRRSAGSRHSTQAAHGLLLDPSTGGGAGNRRARDRQQQQRQRRQQEKQERQQQRHRRRVLLKYEWGGELRPWQVQRAALLARRQIMTSRACALEDAAHDQLLGLYGSLQHLAAAAATGGAAGTAAAAAAADGGEGSAGGNDAGGQEQEMFAVPSPPSVASLVATATELLSQKQDSGGAPQQQPAPTGLGGGLGSSKKSSRSNKNSSSSSSSSGAELAPVVLEARGRVRASECVPTEPAAVACQMLQHMQTPVVLLNDPAAAAAAAGTSSSAPSGQAAQQHDAAAAGVPSAVSLLDMGRQQLAQQGKVISLVLNSTSSAGDDDATRARSTLCHVVHLASKSEGAPSTRQLLWEVLRQQKPSACQSYEAAVQGMGSAAGAAAAAVDVPSCTAAKLWTTLTRSIASDLLLVPPSIRDLVGNDWAAGAGRLGPIGAAAGGRRWLASGGMPAVAARMLAVQYARAARQQYAQTSRPSGLVGELLLLQVLADNSSLLAELQPSMAGQLAAALAVHTAAGAAGMLPWPALAAGSMGDAFVSSSCCCNGPSGGGSGGGGSSSGGGGSGVGSSGGVGGCSSSKQCCKCQGKATCACFRPSPLQLALQAGCILGAPAATTPYLQLLLRYHALIGDNNEAATLVQLLARLAASNAGSNTADAIAAGVAAAAAAAAGGSGDAGLQLRLVAMGLALSSCGVALPSLLAGLMKQVEDVAPSDYYGTFAPMTTTPLQTPGSKQQLWQRAEATWQQQQQQQGASQQGQEPPQQEQQEHHEEEQAQHIRSSSSPGGSSSAGGIGGVGVGAEMQSVAYWLHAERLMHVPPQQWTAHLAEHLGSSACSSGSGKSKDSAGAAAGDASSKSSGSRGATGSSVDASHVRLLADQACDWCGGAMPAAHSGSSNSTEQYGCLSCGAAQYCRAACADAARKVHNANCWRLQALAHDGLCWKQPAYQRSCGVGAGSAGDSNSSGSRSFWDLSAVEPKPAPPQEQEQPQQQE